jgi:hypothetical protein
MIHFQKGLEMAKLGHIISSVKNKILCKFFSTCKILFRDHELESIEPGSFGENIMKELHVDPALHPGFWAGMKAEANIYLGQLRQQVNSNKKCAYLSM